MPFVMPWWGWAIIAFVALALICAIVRKINEKVGELLILLVCWIIAFPIMLIITIVKAAKGNKGEKKK